MIQICIINHLAKRDPDKKWGKVNYYAVNTEKYKITVVDLKFIPLGEKNVYHKLFGFK